MAKGFPGRTIQFESGVAAAQAAQVPHEPLIGALEQISRIAQEAPSVAVGMPQGLAALCTALQWPIGHVYHLTDARAPALTSAAIWHLEHPEQFTLFQAASERLTFRPGRGLVGQVLARRRPGLSPDVSRDVRFLRRQAAIATGVRAWLAFPVVVDGCVVAICECFTTERVALDASVAGLLSCAGLALARLYERERWQAAHARLIEQLAAVVPAAPTVDRAALSALAGAISHEVNSPLFAARTSLALLAAERPGAPRVAGAQAELARIAAVLDALHPLAMESDLSQRIAQFMQPPTA